MTRTFPGALLALALILVTSCGVEDGAADLASSPAASRGREGGDDRDAGRPRKVLEIERMAGVARPYVGTANPVRGLSGGGLPWIIHEGEAKLWSDGRLQVKVEGVQFDPNDAAVQARGLGGQNTVASFKAVLSCQTIVDGAAAVVNVSTAAYPATTGPGAGDAEFSEVLAVPSPCYGPMVFITSPGGAWFAASSL
jgi:hypothetical protein